MSPRWCHRCGGFREPDHDHPPTLFDEPEPRKLARVSDPSTSTAAAFALSGAQTMRRKLLAAFAEADRARVGLTAEQAADLAGYEPVHCAWKRVSDLLNLGLIEDTGETRIARSGREQRVLRITVKGREAA